MIPADYGLGVTQRGRAERDCELHAPQVDGAEGVEIDADRDVVELVARGCP